MKGVAEIRRAMAEDILHVMAVIHGGLNAEKREEFINAARASFWPADDEDEEFWMSEQGQNLASFSWWQQL